MIVSCKERLSEPQRGSYPRRSFRQSDRLWSVRRRQVGLVVCESTSSDIPSMYHRYADAWGNEMSGYTTGEWTSTWASRDGWGHNTKEYDGDTGLVYMYQRWYQPELGVFMSQAPLLPMYEHQYSFAIQNPISYFDPRGEDAHVVSYRDGWRHTMICFDDGDGSITCFDLRPGGPTERCGCGDGLPWGKGSVGYAYDKNNPENYFDDLSDFPEDEFKIITYPGSPVQDQAGKDWGERQKKNKDRSYKFPFTQCWNFAGVGAEVYRDAAPFAGVAKGWVDSGALCPRVDALIDGQWIEVGRAIKHNHGYLNAKKWIIVLNQPCKKFRLVEDEPEVSYVKWIKGDGEDWSLGSIETKPASFFGANDGSVHYFEFSNEVSVLETYGYYNLIDCLDECCALRQKRE